MSDVDEELLGLVGGDSDDDEGDSSIDDLEQLDQTHVVEDRSPSQEAKESVEKVEEPQNIKRGVAQKVKSRGRRKRKQESEDEEDGEASPDPTDSVGSGALAESDGEADAPGEVDEEEAFPVDGKFRSKADREHILSLPEIQREEILAERAEEIQRKKQDAMLKQALAGSHAKQQKRKASAVELEEGSRRATRPKTDKRSALDDYRRAREQKGAERSRLESARDRKAERSPSVASDRDADGESEVEWAEPASNSRRDEPPAEIRDFERCRVGRTNFAAFCFYPGFEDTIKGCFTRVSIGMNRETGQNQYRMTQIKGFVEGKPYQLEMANGKHFTIDQYAIVAQGPHEKPWPFSACSDSKFTDREFARFTETLKKSNMHAPSRKFLNTKLNAIHGLINHKFTEETLQIKFSKQRAMESKYDPVQIAKQKRKDIEKRRVQAEQDGDEEEVARCETELEALNNSTANGASKPKSNSSPAKPMQAQDRLALLNQANRAKNIQEVRQALINERKKIQREREALAEKKKLEVRDKVHAKANDRAKKQATRMKDLFGETPDGSRAGTPANGTDTPKKNPASASLNGNGAKKGPIGALKQRILDDEVIGGLDLGIDVEI